MKKTGTSIKCEFAVNVLKHFTESFIGILLWAKSKRKINRNKGKNIKLSEKDTHLLQNR